MRTLTTLLLTLALAAAAGCATRSEQAPAGIASSPNTSTTSQQTGAAAQGGGGDVANMKTVSLERTEDPAAPPQQQSPNAAPVERKIIRNATLTLEVEQPSK